MIACEQGDVVLLAFAFTDESGGKRRPAVIVSTSNYHRNRQEAIIAAITSNVDRLLLGTISSLAGKRLACSGPLWSPASSVPSSNP